MKHSENVQIVDYKTFSNDIFNHDISDINIYKITSEIEVTYKLDGKTYATKGPYGPHNDALLHKTLDNKNIKYTILEKEYKIDGNSSNDFLYSGILVVAIPVIMLIIILIQALTIKKLALNERNTRQ